MSTVESAASKAGTVFGCGCMALFGLAMVVGLIGECTGKDPLSVLDNDPELQEVADAGGTVAVLSAPAAASARASLAPPFTNDTPLPIAFEQQVAVEAAIPFTWSPSLQFLAQERDPGRLTIFGRLDTRWLPLNEWRLPSEAVTAVDITDSGYLCLGLSSGAVELWQVYPPIEDPPGATPTLPNPDFLWRIPDQGGAVLAVATNETAELIAVRCANDIMHLFAWDAAQEDYDSAAYWEFTAEQPANEKAFPSALTVAADGTVAEGNVEGMLRLFHRNPDQSWWARWWVPRTDKIARITSLAMHNDQFIAIGDAASQLTLYRRGVDPTAEWEWLASYDWADEGLVTAIAVSETGAFAWGTTTSAISVHEAGGIEYAGTPASWDWAPRGAILSLRWLPEGTGIEAINSFGDRGAMTQDAAGVWSTNWESAEAP